MVVVVVVVVVVAAAAAVVFCYISLYFIKFIPSYCCCWGVDVAFDHHLQNYSLSLMWLVPQG